ncbi:o-succinylbenzoate--CoA ligase [candidate division KSB1 bacterium]|nr:o-succinylbenzoate--CoA ligase [candidate division KSB1 bacterium]
MFPRDEKIDLLHRLRALAPTHPFLGSAATTVTAKDYVSKVASVYHELKPLKDETRIAIYAENSVEALICLQAIWHAGKIAIMVPTRWPREQIQKELLNLNCRVYFATHAKMDVSTFRHLPLSLAEHVCTDSRTLPKVGFQTPTTIVFTSGSTGHPKAVCHSMANHFFSALGSQANIPFGSSDRWLLCLPHYHIGGLAIFMRALFSGGSVHVGSLENAQGITHLSAVATMMIKWLDHPDWAKKLKPLKAILLGGSAIPPSLVERCVALQLAIHTSYGNSEMASQIATTPPGADLETLQTSGYVLPYGKMTFSQEGELWVRGKTLFLGYVQGARLDPARNEQGWFCTGDKGFMDEHQRVHIIGRSDNIFISGGENISAQEIEHVLSALPFVKECVVVAVQDVLYGQRPVAFIRTAPDVRWDENTIKKQLKTKLAKFKIPDRIWDWPDVNTFMKPDRKKFETIARERVERDRNRPD